MTTAAAPLTAEANRTIDHLTTFPKFARSALATEDLRSLLLYTEGWLLVAGSMYYIHSKHLGAGIYNVWLEPRV